MSQPEEIPAKPPGESKPKTPDLFTEALNSGKAIEGLFEMKRREEMQANGGRRNSKRRESNGLKDPLCLLKERIAIYNKKMDEEFQLVVDDEDLSYSGHLMFTYHNGYHILSERIKLTSMTSAIDIIPTLLRTFLPQYDANESNASNNYIILSQGGSERELEANEKPLLVALDCSTKGLSPTSFTLRTSITLLLSSTSSLKRNDKKLSSLSLQASSLTSLGHTSSDCESPKVGSPHIMFGDQDSLYSFSSTSSIPSYSTNHNVSNDSRSPRLFTKGHSRSKSHSKFQQAQKLAFENSYHKTSDPVLSVSPGPPQLHTPEMSRKGGIGGGKSRSKVGNFIARTLKSKKKIRPPSIYPEGSPNVVPDPRKSALVSPKLAQKCFAMPTVFHIYYSKAKNMQLYKSVLVLERSNARDVIKQALERYGMKFNSPDSFHLYEVIGRWVEVSTDFEPALERSVQILNTKEEEQPNKPARAFEEFVECYVRKLRYNEKPYEVQFFHEPQTGYTRRFELRSVASEEEGSLTDGTSHDQFVPTTPLFGSTAHTFNERRSRSKSQDTFEFSAEEETYQETTGNKIATGRGDLSLSHSLVDCSSPDSVDILTPSAPQPFGGCSSFPSPFSSSVFLLNLLLVPSNRDLLMYSLLYEQFVLKSRDFAHQQKDGQAHAFLDMLDTPPESVLCSITRGTQESYKIEPGNSCSVSVNGRSLNAVTQLHHGDLIKLGHTHLFMFQNHNKHDSNTQLNDNWPYQWTPLPITDNQIQSTLESKKPSSLPIQIPSTPPKSTNFNATVIDEIERPQSSSPQVVFINPRDEVCSLPTLPEVEDICSDQVDFKQQIRKRSYSDTKAYQQMKSREVMKQSNQRRQHHSQALTSGQLPSRESNKLGSFPADRKLMFSYNIAEEDTLLELLIDDLDPLKVIFSLAPAYTLCMCMEYSMRCSGARPASRLACKAVQKIHRKVESITNEISLWKPKTLYPSLDEFHSPLCSILFWLANTLEFYNFLLSQEALDLTVIMQSEGGGDSREDNAMTLLETIMQHLFQQAFYPISKILYVVLPRMLEEGDEMDRSSCVHYVVDFLKRILELMCALHIHTEMVAQFFANIFFFLNGAMFNALIDHGPELRLFQFSIGQKLRTKLDILENWAGREGFRDGPLQFIAVFSSAIDLIATPPEELLALTWSVFREEFPALLPSQLQYILTHYRLDDRETQELPRHWEPLLENGKTISTQDSLYESFESHPQFEIPIGGCLLDLDSQSCDSDMLHKFVDALQKDLKKRQKSVNIVGIKKKKSSAPTTPIMVYSTNTYPPNFSGRKKKPLLNIKDIVTSDLAKTSYSCEKSPVDTCFREMRYHSSSELTQLRGRVKSIIEPHFTAPEKLTISLEKEDTRIDECDETVSSSQEEGSLSVTLSSSRSGSRTLCLQRGNKGFGFNTETRKDPITGVNKLFISSLLPNGGIEDIVDLSPGDEIMAVDEMEMSCEKFQQYIKDAEEEITLTVLKCKS